MFNDFEELNDENEDMFEFMAYNIVIQFLERNCLCLLEENETNEALSNESRFANCKWDTALEFPDNLASMGRSKLHEVANYFNLSHHSRGRKDNVNGKKRRRAVLYPKTLFTDKQI